MASVLTFGIVRRILGFQAKPAAKAQKWC
jgi:hypothetical protein